MPDTRVPLKFEPLGNPHLILTPRPIADASTDWFKLQRQWWRQTLAPLPDKLPEPDTRFTLDLNEGWAFKPL